MRNYIEKFLMESEFPKDCANEVLRGYDAIKNGKYSDAFEALLSEYDKGVSDFEAFVGRIDGELSPAFDNGYAAVLVLYCAMTRTTRRLYNEKGIGEDIFMRTAADIKYKAIECKLVKGDWGIFCKNWFGGFFSLRLFGFESLQFKLSECPRDYVCGDCEIRKDSPVIEVHIPRTGKRLDHGDVLKAYSEAADFFKKHFALKKIIFSCASWLLFPRNLEILKPESNIAQFISDYTIADSGLYDDYSQVWRLFDTDYTGDADKLPADSSFRRGYIDWIKRGEKTGYGVGFIIY